MNLVKMNTLIQTWGELLIITCITCIVSTTLQDGELFELDPTDSDIAPTIINETLQFIGSGIKPMGLNDTHFFWYRNETVNIAADIDNNTKAGFSKPKPTYEACNVTKIPGSYICAVSKELCLSQPITGFVQKFTRPSTYLLQVGVEIVNNNQTEVNTKPNVDKPSENCTLTCSAKKDYKHEMKCVSGETVYLTCISPLNHIKQDVTFSWKREDIEFISSYEGGNVSSLEFKPVKKDDEGFYTCCVNWKVQAQTEQQKGRCYSIYLTVQENKTEKHSALANESHANESEYVVGILSENFTLFCNETGPEIMNDLEDVLAEPKFPTLHIILGCIIAFVLLNVGLIIYFYKRKPSSNHTIVKQIVVRIKTSSRDNQEEARLLPDVRIETQRSTKTRKNKSACPWEYKLPLDEKWEFPREQLNIISGLGVGNFGKVMMAQATSLIQDGVTSIVAVKMLKDCHTDSDMVDLVKEMEIMKIIGKHENVVNFLGCCTQDGPLYVIIEYAEHGSLLNFLRKYRTENDGYELPTNLDLKLNKKLSQKTLISFAYQIARGMEYLSLSRCIHRDLAARNILVSENYVMKIADFGLARDIGTNDYYRKTDDCRLPVRWMAPECINVRKFSSQSDVWSFGILLWEIMTLGAVPYPTYTKLDQLFEMIKQGGRMEKPPICSPEVYKIMLTCWSWNPENRPSFSDLVIQFDKFLMEISDKKYIDLEPAFSEKNEKSDSDSDSESEYDGTSTKEETITLLDENDSSEKKNVYYQNTSEALSDGGFFSDDQQEKIQDDEEITPTNKVKWRKKSDESNSNYLELLELENSKEK